MGRGAYCLLGLLLLMSACGTKREAVQENRKSRFISDVSVLDETVREDKALGVKVAETEDMTLIRERVTTEVHDTEAEGSPIAWRTVEEREYRKDIHAMSGDVTDSVSVRTDSVSGRRSVEADEVVEAERETVKEESGFFASMGKWTGIGAVAVVAVVLLWKRIRKIFSVS